MLDYSPTDHVKESCARIDCDDAGYGLSDNTPRNMVTSEETEKSAKSLSRVRVIGGLGRFCRELVRKALESLGL